MPARGASAGLRSWADAGQAVTDAEVFALIVLHRISLDAGTRIKDAPSGVVELPIWIARRGHVAVSRETAAGAVVALAGVVGLLPRSARA